MTDFNLLDIPLDAITPDPNQPRNLFPSIEELTEQVNSGDQRAKEILEKLIELATSILEVGLQQPISVYQAEENRYIILDGHRRWLAMKLLQRQGQGGDTITAYVRNAPQTDEEILLSQLNTNIQREDLNVFELARSSQKLKDHLKTNGGTVRLAREDGSIETIELQPDAADDEVWSIIEKKMGIGRPRRYQIQAVLKLPPQIQVMAEKGNLAESRLRYLIPLKDERVQEAILKEMLEKNLSNAEIKQRIKELQEGLTELPPMPMPKPMRIKSAIKPIGRLAKEFSGVKNVAAAVSAKDPRTVEHYRELIPELKLAIENLGFILKELQFLEEG